MVLKLLKSIVWLTSYGAGLLIRIGDILASEGMGSVLSLSGGSKVELVGGILDRGGGGGPSAVREECFFLPAS